MNKLLLEHLNIDGATYITSNNGFDLYEITTYEAAQQFTGCIHRGSPAGADHFQNQDTFNQHITNGNVRAFFITASDSNAVLEALITSNSSFTVTVDGNTATIRGYEKEGDAQHPIEMLGLYSSLPDVVIVDNREDNQEVEDNTEAEETEETNSDFVFDDEPTSTEQDNTDAEQTEEPVANEPASDEPEVISLKKSIDDHNIKIFNFMKGDVPFILDGRKDKNIIELKHINAKTLKQFIYKVDPENPYSHKTPRLYFYRNCIEFMYFMGEDNVLVWLPEGIEFKRFLSADKYYFGNNIYVGLYNFNKY